MLGQREFLRLGKRERLGPCQRLVAKFAEDAADAREGVEQVRRGVADECEHGVPVEHVVALSVAGEVGVLDRADADNAGDVAPLLLGEVGVFFAHGVEGALLGLVEQTGEADDFAAARLERPAVLAKDRAEPDVVELHAVARFPAVVQLEELLEVQLLPAVGDVNDLARLPTVLPVLERREVGRGVVGCAVAFLDDGRVFLEQLVVIKKDDLRAVAFLRDALGDEFVDDALEAVVVKTLAERLVEIDTEAAVNLVELMPRQLDHFIPNGEVFGVAALQLDELAPGADEDGLVLFAGGVDEFVEALHLGEGVPAKRVPIEVFLPADEQFAELRAPVADVIVGDNAVAEQPERLGQGIAENGRADVADVHRLGHVGRRVVDDDRARLGGGAVKKMLALGRADEGIGEGVGLEPEIEKTRPGDIDRLAAVGDVELLDDLGGEFAGVELVALGQAHEGVGLVVAKLRLGAGADEDARDVGVGHEREDGLLQFFL